MAEKEVHLRDYFAVIRKHDFVVIVSFLLIFGSALIASLYMPRVYEAAATIEIQSSGQQSGLPSVVQSVVGGADLVSMETICQRFTSRYLLSETIRNLKKRMPEMSSVLESPEALEPNVLADIVPDTRMIEVTVRMRRDKGGSQTATRITNEMVSVMQAHQSAKTDAEMEKRRNFVDKKIAELQLQINSADEDVMNFLKENGDALIWSARVDYVLNRLASLMEFKERSEILYAAQKKKLHELESRMNAEPQWLEYSKTFSQDPLWDKARLDLSELETRLAAARTEYGDNSPNVKSLEAQAAVVRAEIGQYAHEVLSSKTESRNPMYQSLLEGVIDTQMNLISYEAQREIADKMFNTLNEEREQIFSDLARSKFELDKKNREANYDVGIYGALLQKRLETEILASENSDDTFDRIKGGIEIVDAAQPGSRPVSPRVRFIAAIAALVGLVVGLAMAFLAEYFENT